MKKFLGFNYTQKRWIQFACMEFLFWGTFAAVSFEIAFLRDRDIQNVTIGSIMSIVACTRIFSQPLWGVISDRMRSIKRIFSFCLAMSSIAFLVLPFSHSVVLICLNLVVFTLFSSSLIPLLDSWVVQGISENQGISYGSVRLWGSIGYAIMTFIYGKLIDYTSINIIFPAYFIMAIFTIFLSINVESKMVTKQITLKEMKLARLFSNYYYVIFLLFAFFLNIPNLASMTFLPNLIEELGGSKEQLGMMFSLRALNEIPIFLFGGYLIKRFGPVKLLISAGILYIFQQFFYLFADELWYVIFAQMIGGSAYGFFLLGMINYVYLLTPDELRATGQTVANSISMGLSAIVASYTGGVLIDNLGLHWLYRFGVVNDILVVGLFLLSFLLNKRLPGLKGISNYKKLSLNESNENL